MGLYAAGGDPFAVDTKATAELMRPAVAGFFEAHIQVIDPKSTVVTPYDARTDTGGETVPAVLWDSGPNGALVQPIRSQTIGDYGAQAVGLVAVRIQAAVPDHVELRAGLRIKVLDGGGDAEAARHVYVIGSGIDSSLRWVTRILATVVAT